MAFLTTLKAQANNTNLSVGELRKGVAYPVRSMKTVETKFGRAVTCVLFDVASGGTINVFLPKTVTISVEDAEKYNTGDIPTVSLIFKGLHNRSFIIDFE